MAEPFIAAGAAENVPWLPLAESAFLELLPVAGSLTLRSVRTLNMALFKPKIVLACSPVIVTVPLLPVNFTP